MSYQILIEKNTLISRIALLKDQEWIGLYLDNHLEENLQNQVVVGQVKEVVKNLNAAFVDYGEDKNGLLHFKQIPGVYADKICSGTRLPVQIIKQNVGEKGNKLSGMVNLMGRFLVCLPFEKGISLSKKIQDPLQRENIKNAVQEVTGGKYGFIVRTHARDVSTHLIQEDARKLLERAQHFMKTKDYLSKGNVLYKDPPLVVQLIWEEINNTDELEIICNDASYLEEIKSYVHEDSETGQIKYTVFPQEENMFHIFDLQKKWEQLLSRKIWLKNGGNLIIDYTEAMTVIDVNSAKAIMGKNQRKAVFELNSLAVKESILQILRRNISGMIIIDLVDMSNNEDKQAIYEQAKNLLNLLGDSRTKVYPLTELGLLQFSRTKKYKSIAHQFLQICTICNTPYSEYSLTYGAWVLENRIKEISLKSEQQEVYLQMQPIFYEFVIKNEVKDLLENKYNIKIISEKMSLKEKKLFLCQFYSR